MSSVKTKDATRTPPQYHPDFETNALGLEEHRKGCVARRLGEQFQSFTKGFFVYSRHRPCSGDPCLTSAPSCPSENKLINMQLKQIVMALQNPENKPPTTCPQTPASIPPVSAFGYENLVSHLVLSPPAAPSHQRRTPPPLYQFRLELIKPQRKKIMWLVSRRPRPNDRRQHSARSVANNPLAHQRSSRALRQVQPPRSIHPKTSMRAYPPRPAHRDRVFVEDTVIIVVVRR